MATSERVDLRVTLEHSFREVIETMFGLSLDGPRDVVEMKGLSQSGMIGLAGPAFRGLLHIACSPEGARKLAGALVGDEELLGDDPSMVSDSLGELANMLAGSVKRQLDSSGSRIDLSLPSVMEGEATIHGVGATGDAHLNWSVEGFAVHTSLVYSEQE